VSNLENFRRLEKYIIRVWLISETYIYKGFKFLVISIFLKLMNDYSFKVTVEYCAPLWRNTIHVKKIKKG
jgi:hypothetical protein